MRSRSNCPSRKPPGFSLLEVILATAIVMASSMVLLRLLSTGAEHQIRGERKAAAQRICQSLIDQMQIRPELCAAAEGQPIPGYADWIYWCEVEPTEYEGLVRVRLRAGEAQVQGLTADDDVQFSFELVRWLRLPKPATESADMTGDTL